MFNKPELARYVWIYPTEWSQHISMRADVYVEKKPKYRLTIGNHPENTRTYSSIWGNNRIGTGHARSTINSPQAWSARYNRRGEWMIIDMGYEKRIGGIIIQTRRPRYDYQLVTRVNVYTKDNTGVWTKQLVDAEATQKRNTTRKIEFHGIVLARWVKIEVLQWSGHISMRADVLMVDDESKKLLDVKTKEHDRFIKIYEQKYKEIKANAKKYLESIKNKNAGKNKEYAKISYALQQIKGKLDAYKTGATDYRKDSYKLFSDNMVLDKEEVNQYFKTLYDLHKDQSRDISLDDRSLKTVNSVIERRRKKIAQNNIILKDLDNYIDTYGRHKISILDKIIRRENTSIYMKLTTICLMIVIFIYILKLLMNLDGNQCLYISYFVIALFIGFGLLKFIQDKNNSDYNYEQKKFSVHSNSDVPKSEKEDIKKI